MKTTTVSEARAWLSRLLAQVERRESVLILARGKPVARRVPVREQPAGSEAARFEHRVRRGILRRAAMPLEPARFAGKGRPLPRRGDVW